MKSIVCSAKDFIALNSREKQWHTRAKDLEKYLGVSENLLDDLIDVEDARLPGTCKWLSTKMAYLKWKDFATNVPSVLWMSGKPAAGKSVLAGYVINQLKDVNANCSYFFFKYGDKSKSRLGACLRSLAFQMACTNTQVRQRLLEMQEDDIKFDQDNGRTVWRKLFLSGIFETELPQHYWVIDGLDECEDSSSLFNTMLPKLDESIPLRILITSRESSELEKSFMVLGTDRFQSERISTADTLPDIKILVETKARSLIVQSNNDRTALVEKILGKSNGSFLWTVLVLNELSRAYSEKEINQVLEDVPRGMEPLYHRTLELMSQVTRARGSKLTRTILIWSTCATRPLTTKELDGALRLAVKDSFPKLEETIVALCGQLVTVDKLGRVQMVHETAREFLLKKDLKSEFAIDKTEAHTEIARTCLTYLIGEEMKPPRIGRYGPAPTATEKRVEFSQYAFAAFSYHLAKADPRAHDLLILVDKFLRSNVLSWIEAIVKTQDLISLILAARNLRTYLHSCATERATLGREMQTLRGWTTDLTRITAKFADALITSPSAIYSLIPPFCPKESMVYKVGNPRLSLSVLGLSNAEWDDRLSCIDFQVQTTALSYGEDFFAIGFTNGRIACYHAISCQEYKVLDHGEAVRFLQFKSKSDLMASCGLKTIRIWDIHRGETIHLFQAPQRPICLTFNNDLLIAASHQNFLASWDLDNEGIRQPDRGWNDSVENRDTPLRHPPRAISISVSHKMMAVAYSNEPVKLWDLEQAMYVGSCGKKLPNGETCTHVVSALVFNPNINIGLLAVAYLDGELALLDPFTDSELESLHANCHTLASSPDGRLLAGSSGAGTVQIYEFDTLRLLYRVKAANSYIKQLAFSKDNLHFADIRGSQCNIWEPAVLLRDLVRDDRSESTTTSIFEAVAPDIKSKVSAMVLHPNGGVIYCGKEDGSVSSYDIKTGAQLGILYRHKSLVRILCWLPEKDIIISVDTSNGIFTWKLQKSEHDGWKTEKMLFHSRLDCGKSINQVLPGERAGKFVLSTRDSDHLWSINGHEERTRTCSTSPGFRKWIQHHQSPQHMICVEGATARVYSWRDWSEIASVRLDIDTTGLQLKSVNSYFSGHRQRILLELSELDGSATTRGLHLLDATAFRIANETAQEEVVEASKSQKAPDKISSQKEVTIAAALRPLLYAQFAALAHYAAHIISLSDTGKLIFLDTHSWVCSADLENLGIDSVSFIRHFFVPYDWFSGTRDVICAVTKRDVLFARNDDVAIVKDGLEFVEKVDAELKVENLRKNRSSLQQGVTNKDFKAGRNSNHGVLDSSRPHISTPS
jgi:WD40 repeat protein